MAVKIAAIEPSKKVWRNPWRGQGALQKKTQKGSISTITLAISRVGKSKILKKKQSYP